MRGLCEKGDGADGRIALRGWAGRHISGDEKGEAKSRGQG